MNEKVEKIMETVKKAVNDRKSYINYDFIPEENIISVRVFKYDEMAEYCEDIDSYDFVDESFELLSILKFECRNYAKSVEYYVPTEFDKKGYGYFDYREIVIIPRE